MSLTNFNKILSWYDFNRVSAIPAQSKHADAVISVTWDINAPEFMRNGNAIVVGDYTVNVFLISHNCSVLSSIVGGTQSDELLKHEQGHFDIMALGAREFHEKVVKLKGTDSDDLNKKIDNLKLSIGARADLADARYDSVTNHSINKAVQLIWNQKIETAKKNPKGTVDDLP
jgi:hypothetical protein